MGHRFRRETGSAPRQRSAPEPEGEYHVKHGMVANLPAGTGSGNTRDHISIKRPGLGNGDAIDRDGDLRGIHLTGIVYGATR